MLLDTHDIDDDTMLLFEQYDNRVVPIQVVGDPQSIFAAAQTAPDVQIVINNAGVFQAGTPLAENAIASLEFQMNTEELLISPTVSRQVKTP
ncbi:hypothetical protein [Nostoc sp. FACHB-280]|uniref:hypothetical protein n=1 Tax=Nostoc sp. FACHB-280 TaxID=2692839 RepID=UPI001F548FBC|nr:hypothetical protein [Nostoc sp. FACHB-280]